LVKEDLMRRVLVPLDGSDLAAAILDDAVRLAGADGTLILMGAVSRPYAKGAGARSIPLDTERAREYLDAVAEGLRARGVSVSALARSTIDVAAAIDEVAQTEQVDMIACATHSRGAMGRLLWGSVAWQVLAHSPVPVLLRHPTAGVASAGANPPQRRILVPLDRSELAEQALPLAQELAGEWQAPIDLVNVVSDVPPGPSTVAAEDYLDRIKASLAGQVQSHVLIGRPEEDLAAFAYGAQVTDIVMASHGRTGLARVFLGSVASEIIQRVALPVIVVPVLAAAAARRPEDAGRPEG
jgi:nucleotide-binding universal stress UspA family protein